MDAFRDYTYESITDFTKSMVTNPGSTTLHKLARSYETGKLKSFLKNNKESVDIVDPEPGVTPLISACLAGNFLSIKILIKYGADVNFKCSGLNGWGMRYLVTPIYVAAECGHSSIVEYLGKKGADVNFQCQPQGFTPLNIAVNHGYEGVVALLAGELKAKVTIPSYHTDWSYPLHKAIERMGPDTLSVLLNANDADPNVADKNEHVTPLHLATYKGDLDAVSLLLAHGANINAELVSGHTPLDIAIMTRKEHGLYPKSPLVDLLKNKGGTTKMLGQKWSPFVYNTREFPFVKQAIIQGADPNASSNRGFPTLFSMVLKQDTTHCKFLLRKGANINKRDFFGNTALHLASEIFKGTPAVTKMVVFLLDNGADINAKNHAGATPLHRSCQEGLVAISQILISRGADLYANMHETGPPIFLAVQNGYTRISRMILEAGYDPNAKFRTDTIESTTALHVASTHAADSPETIRVLVDHGANVNEPQLSPFGKIYPLHLVASNSPRFTKSMVILMEAGAFIDAECFPIVDKLLPLPGAKLDAFNSIIKSSGNPKAALIYNSTVELFKAVRKNDLAGVQKYERQKGLVNCCSVKFETPLTYASWKGENELLLNNSRSRKDWKRI